MRLRCACTIDGVRLRILGIVVDLCFFPAVCEKAVWHTHHTHMPREGRMMGDALAERSLRIEEVVDTAACVASRGTKCASVEPSCASTSFHVHRHFTKAACSLLRRGFSDLRRRVVAQAGSSSSSSSSDRTTDRCECAVVGSGTCRSRPPTCRSSYVVLPSTGTSTRS